MCKRLHNICLRYIFRYFNQKGLKQLHFYGNIVTELSHVIQERDEGAGTHISSTPFTYVSAGDRWLRVCCLYELLPFTFALPFGQLFSIPLRAGDRWLRVCWVISTVQVILFSVSYEFVLSLADKSIFRDTERPFQITEWRFRTTECTFRVTERNFL